MLILTRFVITLLCVFGIFNFIPQISIHNSTEALFFAVILALINALIRPVLILLTLPITILTLGLFTLVINMFTFWLAAEVSYGVSVTLLGVVYGGLIMWVVGFITNQFIFKRGMH